MCRVVVFALLCLPMFVQGAEMSSQIGKITDIVSFPKSYGQYSESEKGLLGIYVEGLPKACGSGNTRVVIGVDHPIYQSVLSMALYAKASGSQVKVQYFESCTLRSDSWDLAYFVLK